MTLSDLRALVANLNVGAMLRVIRQRESNQDESAYTLLNGGGHFTVVPADPAAAGWQHPWDGIPTTQGARASGAYQFLGTTWHDVAQRYAIPDFSPPNQDAGAVAKIIDRGALDDVLAGRLDAAIAKLRQEWTSLPGAAESAAGWTLAKARETYIGYGGTLDGVAPAVDVPSPPAGPNTTISGESMDPLSLVTLLTSVFGPVLRAKLDKVLPTDVGKPLIDGLLAQVTQLTGKADPLEAVAVARQQPAVIAKLEQSADDWMAQLAPALERLDAIDRLDLQASDASRDAASTRTDATNVRERIDRKVWWAYGIAGALLAEIAIAELVINKSIDGQIVGALILAFGGLGGAIITMVNYGFGSSGSSGAKDVLIGEMARRQTAK